MIADKILPLLDKVKSKGGDCWLACCPAHDDTHPSLAIREVDNRLLLHCLSNNCSVFDIVESIGLNITDLFPERVQAHNLTIKKKRFPAEAVLEALAEEFVIAELGLAVLADGGTLNEKAQARMKEASNRFTNARIAGGWLC